MSSGFFGAVLVEQTSSGPVVTEYPVEVDNCVREGELNDYDYDEDHYDDYYDSDKYLTNADCGDFDEVQHMDTAESFYRKITSACDVGAQPPASWKPEIVHVASEFDLGGVVVHREYLSEKQYEKRIVYAAFGLRGNQGHIYVRVPDRDLLPRYMALMAAVFDGDISVLNTRVHFYKLV